MSREVNLKTLPRCATCNKPVDKMTERYDDFKDELIITAQCHGQRSEQRITGEILRGLRTMHFRDVFPLPRYLGPVQ